VAFGEAYQSKDSVIDNIEIVGVDAFGNDRCAGIVFDLFDTKQFYKNKIGQAAHTHVAPGFAVIVVLVLHQRFCGGGVFIIQHHRFFGRQIGAFVFREFQLDQRDDRIIDHADIFAANVVWNSLRPVLFDGANALRFNKNLVGDRRNPEHAPRSAVILQLFCEDIPADGYTCVVLLRRIFHKRMIEAQNKHFQWPGNPESPVVMGILNATPDSFFDGGKYPDTEAALARARQILEEGASIIDIGGASTRPGSSQPGPQEEWERIGHVIRELKLKLPQAILSVDTFHAEVAEKAVDAGAQIVNDVSGGEMDPKMFATVARLGVPYVLMHMRGTPETMQKDPQYTDVVREVKTFFESRIEMLNRLGHQKIILDPGFGFGKTVEHNYRLLQALGEFVRLGYPVLAGFSRKSMITKLLGVGKNEALNGTTALNTIALQKGAMILRVHDVKEAVECVRIHGYLGGIC
jgi:dihydropteroate synthase